MNQILCIGSVNLDHTYQVPHIVRPGETIACAGYRRHWGGKGLNQALALARAGADAHLAARVSAADLPALAALGAENGLDTALTEGCASPTGHAVIQVDGSGQNCIVIYAGANATLDGGFVSAALAPFGPGDLLLLQNEVRDMPGILGAARSRGLTVALNPSPVDPAMRDWPLEEADLLILNEVEGEALTGSAEPDAILDALARRCPSTRLVLTLGGSGSRYRFGGESLTQPVFRATAVDTTAAGDTFTGYFLSSFVKDRTDISAALSSAAKAAAIAVSRRGAADSIPFAAEVAGSQLRP